MDREEALIMIPLIAGYVGTTIIQNNPASIFKMTKMEFSPPDSFLMHFASGLVLRIRVEEERVNELALSVE